MIRTEQIEKRKLITELFAQPYSCHELNAFLAFNQCNFPPQIRLSKIPMMKASSAVLR